MGSVESLAEVGLRFAAHQRFTAKAYVDGFDLQDVSDVGPGWFRQLPLDPSLGWLQFNEENEVTGLRVSGCASGLVEPPTATAGGDAAFRMKWPAECTSTMQDAEPVIRYEVRWSAAAPDRWVQLRADQLWLGLSADGAIV